MKLEFAADSSDSIVSGVTPGHGGDRHCEFTSEMGNPGVESCRLSWEYMEYIVYIVEYMECHSQIY